MTDPSAKPTTSTDARHLEIRTWGFVARALPSAAIAVMAVVLLSHDASDWAGWMTLALGVVMLIPRILALRDALRVRDFLTIDEQGVTWNLRPYRLAWSEVAEIRVYVAFGLGRLLPHSNRITLIDPAAASFAKRAGARPLGHTIPLSQVKASPDSILASLRQFTDAPVERFPARPENDRLRH